MKPGFTIIIAAHNAVETILDAIRSVEYQRANKLSIKVIVVDSHSTDRTIDFVAKSFPKVKILSSPTGGPGEARNVALDYLQQNPDSQTEWLTFLDADDWLDPLYFSTIEKHLEVVSRTSIDNFAALVTQIYRVESDGKINNNHPLRYRFQNGSRIVDLKDEPAAFQSSVATTVFRTKHLMGEKSPRFTAGLRYAEDADFMVRYFQVAGTNIILIEGAKYFYRVGQFSSLSKDAWCDPEKYVKPFELAFIKWIEHYRMAEQHIPRWIQWMLLYEIHWYLEADREFLHPSSQLSMDIRKKCGDYLVRLAEVIDDEEILNFSAVRMGIDRRLAILAQKYRFMNSHFLGSQVISFRARAGSEWRRCIWYWIGQKPPTVRISGEKPEKSWEKITTHSFFESFIVRQSTTWRKDPLPQIIELEDREQRTVPLDSYYGLPSQPRNIGERLEISTETKINKLGAYILREALIQKHPKEKIFYKVVLRAIERVVDNTGRKAKGIYSRIKKLVPNKSLFVNCLNNHVEQIHAGSWLLMDRNHHANENAEVFYRFLKDEGQEIIFALSPESSDWKRLESDGFNLVPTYSVDYWDLVHSAPVICLSDMSDPAWMWAINSPRPGSGNKIIPLADQQKIVFLQHGILRNDLSRLLNPKRIDLMLTTDQAEFDAIVSDGSPYNLTGKEVVLTGMPRHDRLFELASRVKQSERNIILFAPTWNEALREFFSTSASANVEQFDSTKNANRFFGFDECLFLAQKLSHYLENNKEFDIKFFIHPVLPPRVRKYVENFGLACVDTNDLPKTLASSVAVVTDRSSVSDEAVLLGIKVVLVENDERRVFEELAEYLTCYDDISIDNNRRYYERKYKSCRAIYEKILFVE
ncbi:hypothetical protein BK816_00440 [Boudabousia tangfeifanii]|uniref:Glycosyltransferase 2-like domain-containing protein n=1 Tax=Boudabousia tangfeifanii TaxID=1912795 RepID=A0A1D9MI23_9ACTO|nr:glycosyltransferase [Boudabousia tangfeifanii]AOZ71947.1 hypothetical protein BK816_00440 [Boudabousia tangfeifanii]